LVVIKAAKTPPGCQGTKSRKEQRRKTQGRRLHDRLCLTDSKSEGNLEQLLTSIESFTSSFSMGLICGKKRGKPYLENIHALRSSK